MKIVRNTKGANPLSVPALNLVVEHGQDFEVEDQNLAMALVEQGLFEVVTLEAPPPAIPIKKTETSKDDSK